MLELLQKRHERKGFDCGEPALNRFLEQTARQSLAKGTSRTFVWTDSDSSRPHRIVCFFTLTTDIVLPSELQPDLAKRYPDNGIPVVKLARLAIDRRYQGQRIGKRLVWEAIKKAIQVHEATGITALWVDAKNEKATAFYRRLGFISAKNKPFGLYIAVKTLLKAIEQGAA